MAELPDRQSGQRIAPAGGDLGERLKHEIPLPEVRVGDNQAGACEGAFGPQDQIQIEDTRTPAPAGAPAELPLQLFQSIEQIRRSKVGRQDRRGIREAASRRAECRRETDRGEVIDAECRGCLAKRLGRRSMAAAAIGAEGNGVAWCSLS